MGWRLMLEGNEVSAGLGYFVETKMLKRVAIPDLKIPWQDGGWHVEPTRLKSIK